MIRASFFILAALSLALTACHDARQETVRSYLQSHPPTNLEVVAIPEKVTVTDKPDGTGESVVAMRYRLTQPTVEIHDLFSLPRGAELAKRIASVRGWAISALPKSDATRTAITSASAAARVPFSTKRVVTPKGSEIDSLVVVTLHKKSDTWQVSSESSSANIPGDPDRDPGIPFEDSPAVAAKLDGLEKVTRQMEDSRQKYLAARQRAAELSTARLQSLLKTGATFEGLLPDQTPVRVVISRGADATKSIVAVVTIQRLDNSSARYTGGIVQQPSGEAIWRAAQVISLSDSMAKEPLTDASSHPIFILKAVGGSLLAEVRIASEPAISFKLRETDPADLIPDVSPQEASGE